MRFLAVLILTVMASHVAWADCEHPEQYLIAGTLQARGKGARTWNFEKLKRDWERDRASVCMKELFDLALNEAREYWEHIQSKFNCADAPTFSCPEAKFDNVQRNLAYIASLEGYRALALAEGCETDPVSNTQSESVLSFVAKDSLELTMMALSSAVALEECANADLSDSSGIFIGTIECLKGAVIGLFADGAWTFLKDVWSLLSHPLQTFSALKTLAVELATNTTETLAKLASQVMANFRERYADEFNDWQCKSGDEKAAAVCTVIGRGGFDTLALIFGPQIFKTGVGIAKNVTVATARTTGRAMERVASSAHDRLIDMGGEVSRRARRVSEETGRMVRTGAQAAAGGAARIGTGVIESGRAAIARLRLERASRIETPRVPLSELSDSQLKRLRDSYGRFTHQNDVYGSRRPGKYFGTGYWSQWLGSKITVDQGWKLHVSARTDNALQIAEALLPELRRHGIAHKYVEDLAGYHAKIIEGDVQAGKFITIYPNSAQEAELARNIVAQQFERLKLTQDDFVPIMGELASESVPGLYARYGRFVEGPLRRPDGSLEPDVRGLRAAPEWAPAFEF